LDGEVGVEGYGFLGVELGGVEGDVAQASGGSCGGELVQALLEVGRVLGGRDLGRGEEEAEEDSERAQVQGCSLHGGFPRPR